MSEVRVTDALTGGEKCSKPERYDLIPAQAMDEVARVYGYGAGKYAHRNWERGYDWGLSLAALHRHIKKFEQRESYDDESHLHHLAHAVFHCLLLMTFEANRLGTDSRSQLVAEVKAPSPEPGPEPVAVRREAAPDQKLFGRPMNPETVYVAEDDYVHPCATS